MPTSVIIVIVMVIAIFLIVIVGANMVSPFDFKMVRTIHVNCNSRTEYFVSIKRFLLRHGLGFFKSCENEFERYLEDNENKYKRNKFRMKQFESFKKSHDKLKYRFVFDKPEKTIVNGIEKINTKSIGAYTMTYDQIKQIYENSKK